MKRTNKSEKQAIQNYIATRNFTAFCRDMKSMGIVTRSEIYAIIEKYYTNKYLRRFGLSCYKIAYENLKGDLVPTGTNPEPLNSVCYNFCQEMKANKNAGSYKKILVEGGKHIWWASPVYLHSDYNKSIFGDNNEENRRRMEIINAYLMK